jgi:hypothetical protein
LAESWIVALKEADQEVGEVDYAKEGGKGDDV